MEKPSNEITKECSTPKNRPQFSKRRYVNSAQRLNASFKSPVLKSKQPKKQEESLSQLEEEVKKLREKDASLQAEIDQLIAEGLKEEELQVHIEKLHEYNEMKDMGQMLLGRIAMEQGVTTKDLYERFGLDLED